jgi:gamma-glutamyltranspeptidase / glutathione hydrolase
MIKNTFQFATLLLIAVACGNSSKNSTTSRHGLIAENAMVVSAHPLATQVGVEIMKKGGNAVDAAVAVHFALAVVLPAAGNIAGGGFVVYRNKEGEFFTLDYREKAPQLATEKMYLDSSGHVLPTASLYGSLASGVPGSVDGMVKLHERFGRLSWKELLEPSIQLARNGFELTEREANGLNSIQDKLRELNTVLPENLLKDHWEKGDSVYYADLAFTLERIALNGRTGFYEGETARLIVEEMQRGNGLITCEDLKNYSAIWRDPVQFSYKNYTITSMGPSSSGGIALAELMNMSADFPLRRWGISSMKTVHVMAEMEKLVFADRAEYLGDPDFVTIPSDELISQQYGRDRAASINMKRAKNADEIHAGLLIPEHEQTTHFSIVDAEGNAISCTTTLNGGYGNMVVVGGAGFFLNNQMDDFSVNPGSPNMYGLVGGTANAIEPGKRMLSSMTPTIVEKNGQLFMVVGTPGGSTIITSVFQTIINVIDFGMNMQGAVDFKRFHHQWKPDILFYEASRFDSLEIQQLKKLGHELQERSSIGRVDAILVQEDGQLEGAADGRGDDTAMGF